MLSQNSIEVWWEAYYASEWIILIYHFVLELVLDTKQILKSHT